MVGGGHQSMGSLKAPGPRLRHALPLIRTLSICISTKLPLRLLCRIGPQGNPLVYRNSWQRNTCIGQVFFRRRPWPIFEFRIFLLFALLSLNYCPITFSLVSLPMPPPSQTTLPLNLFRSLQRRSLITCFAYLYCKSRTPLQPTRFRFVAVQTTNYSPLAAGPQLPPLYAYARTEEAGRLLAREYVAHA